MCVDVGIKYVLHKTRTRSSSPAFLVNVFCTGVPQRDTCFCLMQECRRRQCRETTRTIFFRGTHVLMAVCAGMKVPGDLQFSETQRFIPQNSRADIAQCVMQITRLMVFTLHQRSVLLYSVSSFDLLATRLFDVSENQVSEKSQCQGKRQASQQIGPDGKHVRLCLFQNGFTTDEHFSIEGVVVGVQFALVEDGCVWITAPAKQPVMHVLIVSTCSTLLCTFVVAQ